ncbi:hypothetical protein [Nocardioides aquaticus]|nr:hypothetical protein [Nocardioides aquaticus]
MALDEVLADAHARDASAGLWLSSEVVSRLSVNDRLRHLDHLLKERDLDGRWPLLVEVLRRFYRLRNDLAHGFVDRVRLDEQVVHVSTVKRGKHQVQSFPVKSLGWLLAAADQAQADLAAVWAAVVPTDEAWHEN